MACRRYHPDLTWRATGACGLMKSDKAHRPPEKTCLAIASGPSDLLCIIQLWERESLRLPLRKDSNSGSGWVPSIRRKPNLALAENAAHLSISFRACNLEGFLFLKRRRLSEYFSSVSPIPFTELKINQLFKAMLSSKASFPKRIHQRSAEWFHYSLF